MKLTGWLASAAWSTLGTLLMSAALADPTTSIASAVAQPTTGSWVWPVAGAPGVTRGFDLPTQRWQPGHRGVDLAGAAGYGVYAAGAGVVRFAGMLAGRPVLSIDHPGGLRTTYEPVTALVGAGEVVIAGQAIGVLQPGHPGCPVAACLHWGLRRGQEYLDPLSLLGLGQVRLLPLRDGPGVALGRPLRAGPAGRRRGARNPAASCRSGR